MESKLEELRWGGIPAVLRNSQDDP